MDNVQQGESPTVQKPIRRFNSKLLIAIAAVFLLAIVAVGGISLLKTLRQNYPPEADLTPAINFFERADIYQCSAGADCAVVAGICGEPVSINANFVTEWEDVGGNIHGKISCPAVLYPKIEDMWAACENSRCIAKGGIGNKDYDLLDWQTYRNEEFGFEVRYPDDWEFDDTTIYSFDDRDYLQGFGFFGGDNGNPALLIYPRGWDSDISFDEASRKKEGFGKIGNYDSSFVSYLTEKNEEFARVIKLKEFSPKWNEKNILVWILKINGLSFESEVVSGDVDGESKKTIGKILSTFRFVESTPLNHWNWESLGCGSNAPCSYKVCSAFDATNCYSCSGKRENATGEKSPIVTTDPRTTADFTCKKL